MTQLAPAFFNGRRLLPAALVLMIGAGGVMGFATSFGVVRASLSQQREATGLILSENSISPITLAAIGATDLQVTSILAQAQALALTRFSDIDAAGDRLAALRGEVQTLEDRVVRGIATETEAQRLPSARGDLSQAKAEWDNLQALVGQSFMASLDDDQRAKLERIVATRAIAASTDAYILDHVEAGVDQRSDAEWVELRDQRSRERTGAAEPDPARAGAVNEFEDRLTAISAIWRQTFRVNPDRR